MEIYGGVIPQWLSEEDRKKLTAKIRRKLVKNGEEEGDRGFSGRDSIKLFSDFFSLYAKKSHLINMNHVADFFDRLDSSEKNPKIPDNFIDSLVDWYDYTVLGQVKKSLYFYNEDQVSKDVLNFIFATNYDIGSRIKCTWTDQYIDISLSFLRTIAGFIAGEDMREVDVVNLAQEIQKKYVKIMAQDRKKITESDLYKDLYSSYVNNLKNKALDPFVKSDTFREGIKAYQTKDFKTFDARLQERIVHMIKKLEKDFNYTEQGAKAICLYVIDRELVNKFS
jgi:hypothetical protein